MNNITRSKQSKSLLYTYIMTQQRLYDVPYNSDMNYGTWYESISAHFRDEMAIATINVLDKALVYLIAAVYVCIIVFLGFTKDPALLKFVIVPAVTFVVVTIVRARIDAPRPYDLYDIDPIIVKNTHGKSLPSRHVASAVAIACAITYVHLDWGALAFTACAIVSFTRIVGGVHFPRDVVAAIAIAVAIALVGFVLIP